MIHLKIFLPAWSYDGQEIFCSERGMAGEIWKMRTDGSNPTQVTRYGGRESWATPDSKYYYTSYGTIWVKSLHSGCRAASQMSSGNSHQPLLDTVWNRHLLSDPRN
jgi:hypothetical protein